MDPTQAKDGVVRHTVQGVDRLFPCPFCGAIEPLLATKWFFDQHCEKFWFVKCGGCLCEGPIEFASAEIAAKAWNRRYDSISAMERRIQSKSNPGVHPSPDASAGVGGATRCSVSK
jgi:transcription elongation factor Elf1